MGSSLLSLGDLFSWYVQHGGLGGWPDFLPGSPGLQISSLIPVPLDILIFLHCPYITSKRNKHVIKIRFTAVQLVPLHTSKCPGRPCTWHIHSLKFCTLSLNLCFVSEVPCVEEVHAISTSTVLRHPFPEAFTVPGDCRFPGRPPCIGIQEHPKQVQGEGATPMPESCLGHRQPREARLSFRTRTGFVCGKKANAGRHGPRPLSCVSLSLLTVSRLRSL